MIRYILAVLLLAAPAQAQVGNATGMGVTPTGGTRASLGALLAAQKIPSSNRLCVIGDSITIASNNADGAAIAASGGTGPYTFATTTLPTGVSVTTSTPNLWFYGNPATSVSGSVTITATDAVAAEGERTYTVAATPQGVVTLTPAGASTGALTLALSNMVQSIQNRGVQFWVPFLTNHRTISPPSLNFGHSGDTTADVLARIALPVAADCGSYLVAVGVNDLGGVTTATMQSNYSAIWAALLATGRPVIQSTILPRTLSTPANDAAREQLWAINRWLLSRDGAIPGLIIVDPAPYFGDAASALATPFTGATSDYDASYDGLHPKGIGMYYVGRAYAEVFARWYGASKVPASGISDLYDATNNPGGNLLPNGVMDFTAGTGAVGGRVTGTAPDGWTATSSDAGCSPCTFTGVAGPSTLSDGVTPAVQIEIAGTAQGGFQTQVLLSKTFSAFTDFTSAQRLQASCKIEMGDGSFHVTSPYIELGYTVSGVAYSLRSGPVGRLVPAVSDASPTVAYSGTISTTLDVAALGAVPTAVYLFVGAYITNNASQPVAGTLKIGACRLSDIGA